MKDRSTITPHVKAKLLVDMFFQIAPRYKFGSGEDDYSDAKKYATICAVEIIASIPMYKGELNPDWEFWQQVKSEIEII